MENLERKTHTYLIYDKGDSKMEEKKRLFNKWFWVNWISIWKNYVLEPNKKLMPNIFQM